MGKKNEHPFTKQGVFAFMAERIGTRWQCAEISKYFGVGPGMMRITLQDLEAGGRIHSAVEGKYRRYFVPSEAEIEAAKRVHFFIPFRPMKGYEAMQRRMASLRESGR